MTPRTVTSLLLGFSLATAGSLVAQQPVNGQPMDASQAQPQAAAAPAAEAPSNQKFIVPAGTKIPLTLRAAISTKTAKPGDAVYLQTNFPTVVGSRVVIPQGVFVQGYIDGVRKPTKMKGQAQLMMHFVSMAFPNGVVIALPGAVDKVPGTNNTQVKDKEGLIQGDSTKAADGKTVVVDSAGGAGLGALAGYAAGSGPSGMGIGIGAGAGAAAGIVEVMLKHGNADIVFQEGSTVTMVMQRPLEVEEQQLAGMKNLTGYDGPEMTPVNAQQMPMAKPTTTNVPKATN